MLCGGAAGIRAHIDEINELNVFPVPDGDTGTNMSRTIDSGVQKIADAEDATLGSIAADFAKGSLFGARGNSGVILSQFFAGICDALADKQTATVSELSVAFGEGVKRAYSAVSNPTEGTILTVFRESAQYACEKITDESTAEELFSLAIEEAERSLKRTKEILPALIEADVVDSGGAGYVCIVKGMYAALTGEEIDDTLPVTESTSTSEVDYDLFTADTVLEYGYCTECLVRLQNAKTNIAAFDAQKFARKLESLGCNSIVAIKDGDILKMHAHTMKPADILTLCQKYGEFLNIKIENMCLQHSEKENLDASRAKGEHRRYGVVTVATGDGMKALLSDLGADIIIDGGQTGNPAAEQFLSAFDNLNADDILVFPNNGNILLTARQAAELWEGGKVTVIPTKTLPQGYAALSVFNSALPSLEDQLDDIMAAKDAVVSGELTVAIRDTVIGGVTVEEGEYIGILDGDLVSSEHSDIDAMCEMIEKIEDLDDRELITLFVGEGVDEYERVAMTDALEERFPDLEVEVLICGQKVYNYLVAIE